MGEQTIKYGLISSNNNSPQILDKNIIIKGRVIDIILDDKHSEFKRLGEWNSLGIIFFNEVDKNNNNDILDLKSLPYARPFYPNKKYYPLKNEIVYILQLPYFNSQNINVSSEFYYIDVINIWNHPHHNALPDNNEIINSEENNIINSVPGVSKKSPTETSINLGNTFKENSDIKTILPYEGDYILEGRFGQSFRFGSTVKSNIKNPWSEYGEGGDPIIIIKNGQQIDTNKEGWVPNLEDINKDLSSIYFTSNQNIPINVASKNQKSFNLTLTQTEQNNIHLTNNVDGDSFNTLLNEDNKNENKPIQKIEDKNKLTSDEEDTFVVSEDSFKTGEGEVLEEVSYNGSIPELGISVKENPNKIIYKGSIKSNIIKNNFGKISDNVEIYSKPFLDLIAYSEGTILKGTNNGYDIIVGYSEIVGWNKNYGGKHPNILIKLNENLSSTAAGRYQFLKKTWDFVAGDLSFNKENQDLACYNYLVKGCKVSDFLMKLAIQFSNKQLYENKYFLQILDKISYKWASISASNGNFRYSNQGEIKPEKAYEVFRQAIRIYNL